ncbi:MAG: glycosyltransferase family 39 protein [Bacteroidales bacterium]|nr:glycosyltransferase family 39 protein [Bacteroidales bacterium]
MKILSNPKVEKETLIFLLLLAFATFLYLFNLGYSDIWIDESFTKALVRHSFRDMTGLIKNDFHPPLYFYGLKLFVTVFGLGNYTIRLFSVLAVLCTLLLGFFAGQRVFGKTGALYFCFLIMSLPMITSWSHDARMYTWAAFATTGIFIYAYLFIKTSKTGDLILLALFSLLAAYTHYYGLFAAFWANVFVFFTHLRQNKNAWKKHLISLTAIVLLYLPWLSVLLKHTQKAHVHFWVPEVSWQIIAGCFAQPFAKKLYMTTASYALMIVIFLLTIIVIYRFFIKKNTEKNLKLALIISFTIFYLTVLTAAIISLFSQPILYSRYITVIVTMLLVPPAVFLITLKNKWLKAGIMLVILGLGIFIAYQASFFSYGPYNQAIQHLLKNHPEISKVVHIVETTAGPLAEYSRSTGLKNYWFNPEGTIVYTNMDVYENLTDVKTPEEFLTEGEIYGIAVFPLLPFNHSNLERLLSSSNTICIDTITDKKGDGWQILFHIVEWQGNISSSE